MSHLWWHNKRGIKGRSWFKAGQNLTSFKSSRTLLCKLRKLKWMKTIQGGHVHKGHRRNCEACQYHCSICGNRAMDETRTRFINYRELYDNGGTCTYECIPSEIKNDHACYHCGRYVPGNKPFCIGNCFKAQPNHFRNVCEM